MKQNRPSNSLRSLSVVTCHLLSGALRKCNPQKYLFGQGNEAVVLIILFCENLILKDDIIVNIMDFLGARTKNLKNNLNFHSFELKKD